MREILDTSEICTSLPNMRVDSELVNKKNTRYIWTWRITYRVTNNEMTYNFPRMVCSMTAQ